MSQLRAGLSREPFEAPIVFISSIPDSCQKRLNTAHKKLRIYIGMNIFAPVWSNPSVRTRSLQWSWRNLSPWGPSPCTIESNLKKQNENTFQKNQLFWHGEILPNFVCDVRWLQAERSGGPVKSLPRQCRHRCHPKQDQLIRSVFSWEMKLCKEESISKLEKCMGSLQNSFTGDSRPLGPKTTRNSRLIILLLFHIPAKGVLKVAKRRQGSIAGHWRPNAAKPFQSSNSSVWLVMTDNDDPSKPNLRYGSAM